MRAIWLEGGERHEYFLDNGAAAVSTRSASSTGSSCSTPGTRRSGYRYPIAVAFLGRTLAAE